MNIYQDLYKKSKNPLKCSEEAKKKYFNDCKDKRNEVFDAKRKNLAYDKKDFLCKGKENKISDKNILIKWKNEQSKKKAQKKKPPFIVGIVRHKIYSPPFLHKASKSTEQKKKILRQSFAPNNYKFKPPKGLQRLKMNDINPISEKGTSSSFTFNSLFINQKQVIKKKEFTFEHVTVRPKEKPLIDSTPYKISPKNSKVTKDVIDQKCKNIKKILCSDGTEEPPTFGYHNLLKFREKALKTNDEAFTSTPETPNQNISTLNPENISCTSSYLNHQKQEESYITKGNVVRKDYTFKPPTLHSCSQQIQNLLEQKDLSFTDFDHNSENKQKIQRTSEIPSPNLSRISFTTTDTFKVHKLTTKIEKIVKENHSKESNNYFEDSKSPINDALNITINDDKSNIVDEVLNFNLSSNPNISILENLNSKIILTDETVQEENLNAYKECLMLSKVVDSPVKRYSTESRLTKNKDIKSNKFHTHNSLNLTPCCTELKNDLKGDEKVDRNLEILFGKEHSNGEGILEKFNLPLNTSKTLKSENIETENNVLSNSNSSNENIISGRSITLKETKIPETVTLNEQKSSKRTEIAIESVAVTKEDKIASSKNIKSRSLVELEELSSRDQNISNLESEIISNKTVMENDQPPIPEKNILNESLDNFIEHEKSAAVLNRALSCTLTPDLSINKVKQKNDFNEKEILEKLDFPLETENNVLSNSNSSNEENVCISRRSIILKENKIPEIDTLNEQKSSKHTEITIESTVVTKEDKIASSENIKSESLAELEELSSRDHNISNLESEIISNKTVKENDQPPISERNDLNEPSDNFFEHEKSATILNSALSCTFTTDLSINKAKKKNEYNEKQPEIIDLSDSPLKEQKGDLSLALQESITKKTLNIETKHAESELLSSSKIFDFIHLVDSPKVEKELSESLIIENKFAHRDLKKTQKTVTDCSTTIELENSRNKLRISSTREIEMVDLISDDEEDAESLLAHIKARFAITTIASPKLNPERVALTSIENVLGSPRKSLYSQTYSKTQNVSTYSPCKTSLQSPLFAKENLPAITEANPMKNLSLCGRKVDVSLTPKITGNTTRKTSLIKINASHITSQISFNDSNELNESGIAASLNENTQKSICKTPRSQKYIEEKSSLVNYIPENTPISNDAENQTRVLSLRSRKIDVTPSPIKTRNTPRKAQIIKHTLPHVNAQTPKKNSEELNKKEISVPTLEFLQNCSSNTSGLQKQEEEKNIPILNISPCKTPQPKLLVKENLPVINTVSSPIRILCLRSRKVDVTPSPKKKTPKKSPMGKKTPVKCGK